MSNPPGLSFSKNPFKCLPWIPITCDSSPHPDIYLVINLHHHLPTPYPELSLVQYWGFFPLLQVSWLIKLFYHFSYCPTLVFLWHATSPSTKFLRLLVEMSSTSSEYLYHIPMTCSFDIFAKQSCSIVISWPRYFANETVSSTGRWSPCYSFIHPSPKQSSRALTNSSSI